MNHKILLTVLFTMISSLAFAAVQCPPKSALTRGPGQNSAWILNTEYVKQGWHEVGIEHTWEYPQPVIVSDLSDQRIQVKASVFKKYGNYYSYRCDYEFTTPVMAPNSMPPVKLAAWAAVEYYNDQSSTVFDLKTHPGFVQKGNAYVCMIKQEGDCQF